MIASMLPRLRWERIAPEGPGEGVAAAGGPRLDKRHDPRALVVGRSQTPWLYSSFVQDRKENLHGVRPRRLEGGQVKSEWAALTGVERGLPAIAPLVMDVQIVPHDDYLAGGALLPASGHPLAGAV